MDCPWKMTAPALLALALTLAVPGHARADDPTMADYEKLVTPALRQAIDEHIVMLNRWPDRVARQAAEQLKDLGDPVIPDLARELSGGHWRSQIACAEIAGHLKASILFDPVLASARNPKVRRHMPVFFTAMVKIDSDRAVPAIIGFVGSRFAEERRHAERFLSGLVGPRHVDLLVKAADRSSGAAHASFLRLLGQVGGEAAREPLLKALAGAPDVADAAARALGKLGDPALAEPLGERMLDARADRRHRAYATMALVHLGEELGQPVFPDKTIPELRRAIAHIDPFTRDAAAVGLAQVGRRSRDPQVAEALDTIVVPTLIRASFPSTTYRDYRAPQDLARYYLRQLTGEDHGLDYGKWVAWWVRVRDAGGFKAVRALEVVPDEQLARLRILFTRLDQSRRDVWYFSPRYDPRRQSTQFHVRQYVMTSQELTTLFRTLERRGLLTARSTGSAQSSSRVWQIELELGRQLRRLTAAGTRPAWMAALEEVIDDWAARLEWQLYFDSERYKGDREAWYREQRAFWDDPATEESDKVRRLKRMMIGSIYSQQLAFTEWPVAARRMLELMEAQPGMREQQARLLLAYVQGYAERRIKAKLDGYDQTVASFCRAIAMSRQPRVAGPLLGFLSLFEGADVQPVIDTLFGHLGYPLARRTLDDPRSDARLRAGAAAAMWLYRDDKELHEKHELSPIDDRLIELLRDESGLVRAAAARSLGRRKAALARPALLELAQKSPRPAVKRAALTAIGRIGGDEAVGQLREELQAEEGDTLGAAMGLAATGVEAAVAPLLDRYLVEDEASLRAGLGGQLRELPRGPVATTAASVALDESRALPQRVRALELLATVPCRGEASRLAPLLASAEPPLKRQAALLLAYYHELRAVPVLLDALETTPDDAALATALTAATAHAIDAPPARLASAWRSWWSGQREKSWRGLLVDAMREDGVDVGPLQAWAASGATADASPEAAKALVEALVGRWYVVRNAAHALALLYEIDRPAPARFSTLAERRDNQKLWRGIVAQRGAPGQK